MEHPDHRTADLPITKQDLEQVHECLRTIAPIESRGMKVATRIELAAALMAAACEHTDESGEEDGERQGHTCSP